MSKPARDRFDDVPRTSGRVGAHRAENPGSNGWMLLLWSVVAALVLLVVGIFVSLVVMGRIALFPSDQESVAPAPEETGIVDTSYSVMILNATPDDGLDDQMRDELITAGYNPELVFATDSDADDFADTTVYYVDDADADAALGLAGLIGGALVEQSNAYASMNTTAQAQLTIVIGLDRTAEAPAE
ncbi:LytR C-terminal domain-containing protein [Microbacterium sp. NPDC056234]|uniref:LytR C-terminal domain-containing protein n=1 Tax=Microbacterium sp. NPDC056234 TaxID=3345757 RepID=UPI0035D75E8D